MTFLAYEQPDLFGSAPIPLAIGERPCPCCRGTGTVSAAMLTTGPTPAVTVRPSDPTTSHKAARTQDPRRFTDGGSAAALLRYLAEHPTSQYVAAAAVFPHLGERQREAARRRASQLIQAGYATFTDRTVVNPNGGGEALVMVVTEQGHRAIERLNSTGHTW
jgi:hypothetical protein